MSNLHDDDEGPRTKLVATVGPLQDRVPSTINTNGSAAPPRLVVRSDPFTASTSSLDPVLDNEATNNESVMQDSIQLSGQRWFVLFAMSTFGLCIALSGDTSPILSLILQLLDLQIDKYIYISQIAYYFMAITAIPTAWFVDKYGIQRTIYSAAFLFSISCTLKALLYSPSLPGWRDNRLYYYIIGGFMSSQMSSLYFLLPLKVSETWFSASERSVAWTVMISQLDLGVCVASYLYPRIMPTLAQIEILAYINMAVLVVTVVVCLACITSAEPQHPPSERVAKANRERAIPFKVSVKRMLTNKGVILHLVHLATFESCTMSIGGVLQAILISAGHTKIFAGNFMSINAFVAIIMLIALASFVHRVANITFACKLGSGLQALLFVAYLATLILQAPGWVVVCISIILNICKCWTIPNLTNMTAHLACGLVPQATIVGLSITLTVIQMTVIQFSFVSLMKIYHKTSDYTHSLIFIGIVALINEAIYQLFFYGRTTKELSADDEEVAGDIESHRTHISRAAE